MSYILRALKKSEEERTKGTVPRITTVHDGSVAPRPRFWAILAVVALVVLTGNAVVLGFGLWDGRDEAPAVNATASPPKKAEARAVPEAEARPSEPASDPAAAPAQGLPVTSPAPAAPSRVAPAEEGGSGGDRPPAETGTTQMAALLEPAAGPEPMPLAEPTPPDSLPAAPVERRPEPPVAAPVATPSPPLRKPITALVATGAIATDGGTAPRPQAPAAAQPQAPSVAETTAAGEQVAVLSEPAVTEAADAGRSVPELWQLPSQIRSQIPTPSISVHVYSPDEAGRFVIVDRRKYWEGDLLEGGLLLESILPDGIVLEFQGRQFKLRNG